MQERVQIHVPQKELGEKCAWPTGAQTPPGSGSLYRVLAAPRLAVLCHFPALFLPTLVERGDEQGQGGWPGCGAKPSRPAGAGPGQPCWRGDLLRISAVAYFGIMESVVSSGCRMQPCV